VDVWRNNELPHVRCMDGDNPSIVNNTVKGFHSIWGWNIQIGISSLLFRYREPTKLTRSTQQSYSSAETVLLNEILRSYHPKD
jgi:hypothetical protein